MINSDKNTTRRLLSAHYIKYPKMGIQDIFKFLYQSTFGCGHLVSDENAATEFLTREYTTVPKDASPLTECLDGGFSRVYLSWLNGGVSIPTLSRIFFLSAEVRCGDVSNLESSLATARDMIAKGELPFCVGEFDALVDKWRNAGYPAISHSDAFRSAYAPAYRVVANEYARYLPLLSRIDDLLQKGKLTVAVDGGSASGKSTLAALLQKVYGCRVVHMDDFFLRPEQRTAARFSEIGGNIDKERFFEEVLPQLIRGEAVSYRPFDCSTFSLGESVSLPENRLTVVEGAYSTHMHFGKYYGLSVFLDISSELQQVRILKRNGSALARRFFEEWIPMEKRYFDGMNVKERADLVFEIKQFLE